MSDRLALEQVIAMPGIRSLECVCVFGQDGELKIEAKTSTVSKKKVA